MLRVSSYFTSCLTCRPLSRTRVKSKVAPRIRKTPPRRRARGRIKAEDRGRGRGRHKEIRIRKRAGESGPGLRCEWNTRGILESEDKERGGDRRDWRSPRWWRAGWTRKRKIKAPPCRAAGAKERSRKDGGRDLDLYFAIVAPRCRRRRLPLTNSRSNPSVVSSLFPPLPALQSSSLGEDPQRRSRIAKKQPRVRIYRGYCNVEREPRGIPRAFRATLARANMYAYTCTSGTHPRRDDTAFSSGEVIRV